jgi:hypothetical protein
MLPVAAVLILILALLPFLMTRAIWPRWISMMLLAWWLPGVLLVALWRLPRLDLPTAGILSVGLGLCWMILLALLVHWLPGPIELWYLVAAYELGALALLVALFLRPPVAVQKASASTWGWVVVLLALACILRLPGLGYHEYHPDEASVLRRAVRVIEGVDDELARHAKGPGEIAVALVVYRALGTANEVTARLPFGLMGVASVLATALLGRRLFSSTAGFWAGVLFALNGYALGLSRLVQYQPAVLLFSTLAVLSAWEFARQREARWLVLGVTFSVFGIVMHYELGLLAPSLLVLAWVGWRRATKKRAVVFAALWAALAGSILVAVTHVPIVLGAYFSRTQGYIGNRLGGLGAFNLPVFVELSTFYNSSYYFFALLLLVLVGLVLGWRRARRRTLLLVLWFLPFFVLHLFVMQFPGTHFYLLMPSWSLLAALPLAAMTRSGTIRLWARRGVLALVAAWLLVSAGYLYLLFFRQAPEYLVNYDTARIPFYWAPYGRDVPQHPRYGFPIHEGWKTLGTLAGWGYLGETFASNERSMSLWAWYLSPLRRAQFEKMPDYIFVATHQQVPYRYYDESLLEGYQKVGEVRVRNEPRIQIWGREPLPVPYVTYQSENFAGLFDTAVPVLDQWPDPPSQVSAVPLGGAITLESAGLERTALAPGDTLHMLLVWRPQQALDRDYKVFVHLSDENARPLAQWDGFPCLNTARTSRWVPGEAIRDHVVMTIPEGVQRGKYSLLVGLYDGATGERLGDEAIPVAEVAIH